MEVTLSSALSNKLSKQEIMLVGLFPSEVGNLPQKQKSLVPDTAHINHVKGGLS